MGILPLTSAEAGFHATQVITCLPMCNLMTAFDLRELGGGTAPLVPGIMLAGYYTKHIQSCSVMCLTSDSFIASWRQDSSIVVFKNYSN